MPVIIPPTNEELIIKELKHHSALLAEINAKLAKMVKPDEERPLTALGAGHDWRADPNLVRKKKKNG